MTIHPDHIASMGELAAFCSSQPANMPAFVRVRIDRDSFSAKAARDGLHAAVALGIMIEPGEVLAGHLSAVDPATAP